MSRHTVVEFPVFGHYLVHVELTSDMKKTLAKYPQTRDIWEDQDESTYGLAVHVKGENFSYIFLSANPSVGNIVHESWHVVRRMMQHLGVELDSETVAYHLGYLVDNIFKFARHRR